MFLKPNFTCETLLKCASCSKVFVKVPCCIERGAESKKQKAESKKQKAKSRERKEESRRRKAKSRKRKAQGEKQKALVFKPSAFSSSLTKISACSISSLCGMRRSLSPRGCKPAGNCPTGCHL